MDQEIETEVIAEPDVETFSVFNVLFNILESLQANAWFIVAFAALGYYIWNKKLSSIYEKWKQEQEVQRESEELKKDPDLYAARENARLEAVRRLQDKYNVEAVLHNEKRKEKEQKKREEWLAKQNVDVGRKAKNDYQPLSGGPGPTYRAPKKSTCPGSSCGNR